MIAHEQLFPDIPTMDFATGAAVRQTDTPFAMPYALFMTAERLRAARGRCIARFLDDLATGGYSVATLTRLHEAEGLDFAGEIA